MQWDHSHRGEALTDILSFNFSQDMRAKKKLQAENLMAWWRPTDSRSVSLTSGSRLLTLYSVRIRPKSCWISNISNLKSSTLTTSSRKLFSNQSLNLLSNHFSPFSCRGDQQFPWQHQWTPEEEEKWTKKPWINILIQADAKEISTGAAAEIKDWTRIFIWMWQTHTVAPHSNRMPNALTTDRTNLIGLLKWDWRRVHKVPPSRSKDFPSGSPSQVDRPDPWKRF